MHDNDSLMPESFELPRPQSGAKSPDEAIMGPAFTLMDAGLLGAPPAGTVQPSSPFGQTTLEPVPEAEPLRLPFEEPTRRHAKDEWSMLDQEYPYPSGGGAAGVVTLNIQEQDGTPNVSVVTIKVPNGTLTDEGNGVVSLSFSSTLQQAYNNGSAGVDILTDSTRLGVTIRRGSAADSDVILSGQNGAGTDTFVVKGDGTLWVGDATGYAGIAVFRLDDPQTSLSLAAPTLAIVNQMLVTDNYAVLEFAGAVAAGPVKGTFGRIAAQIKGRSMSGAVTDFVFAPTIGGLVEGMRLATNVGDADCSLHVNIAPGYGGAIVVGKTSTGTTMSTAPLVASLVNENTTNDNWVLLEFAGRHTSNARVSFGRLGMQVRNHTTVETDFMVAPITGSTITERLRIAGATGSFTLFPSAGGAAVFNENGVDADFRVEGDTQPQLFLIDASDDAVIIGGAVTTPAPRLTVRYDPTATSGTLISTLVTALHAPGAASTAIVYGLSSSAAVTTSSGAGQLVAVVARATNGSTGTVSSAIGIEATVVLTSTGTVNAAFAGYFKLDNGSSGTVGTGYGLYVDGPTNFGTMTDYYAIRVAGNVSGSTNNFYGLYIANPSVATFRQAILTESGHVTFNENGGDYDFRVEGDTDVNCLFLDASVDRIGIGTSTPQVKLDVNGGIATRATTNATITADQNDYAIGAATFFRLATDAQRTITGLTGGVDGKLLVIRNTGTFNLVLAHNSGSSAAANRILTGTGEDVVVPPDAAAILIYDATTQRWQMV